MRDAFGGAFMIQVFIVFIFIYICFTAVALNYAKAFKVKNMLIDYLEENQISDLGQLTVDEEKSLENFINNEIYGNMNYHVNVESMCNGLDLYDDFDNKIAYCNNVGIFIKRSNLASNTEGHYYTVSTYVGWSIPFLNKLLALNGNNEEKDVVAGTWKISGQTRLIVNE